MRKFNYLEDHGVISTVVKGYINQLLMEINLLKETNNMTNNLLTVGQELIVPQKKSYNEI